MSNLKLLLSLLLNCLVFESLGGKVGFFRKDEKGTRMKLFEEFTKEMDEEEDAYRRNLLNEDTQVSEFVPLKPEEAIESSRLYSSTVFVDFIKTEPEEGVCVAREIPEFYYKTSENKCYVLVLSGGANRGAWQTGVLRGLVGKHTARYNDTIRWDVIGGVSVGGILALTGLFYEPGEEKSYTDRLWSMWSTVRQDYLSDCSVPIWKNLFKFVSQYIGSLINPRKKPKNAICDHTPLFHYLNDTFGHLVEPYKNETYIKIKAGRYDNEQLVVKRREVLVSAVRFEDGEYVTWNSSATKLPDLINATLASTSVPGAFSPVVINGSHYIDGGVIMNMNIEDSIKACFRLGLAKRQEDIVIDAIETFPDKRTKVSDDEVYQKSSDITFLNLLSRSYSILHSQVTGLRLLRTVLCRYSKINLRYYISPAIEEYQEFPKSAFDGDNLTGILTMLRSGLKKGWNSNFTSINECMYNNDLPGMYGSDLFQV